LIDLLVSDLERHVKYLERLKSPLPPTEQSNFHH
jgi:hypothetical protein